MKRGFKRRRIVGGNHCVNVESERDRWIACVAILSGNPAGETRSQLVLDREVGERAAEVGPAAGGAAMAVEVTQFSGGKPLG